MPSPPVAHDPSPLVGRTREQGVLRAQLDVALTGRGSLVLIGGEAGIGKTALAEALCAEAAAQGALVLVGRCYDLAETPPHGPWDEAFARAPHDGALPPDLSGGSAASQATLFATVRDFLTTLAAQRPLVLLFDDLHWADPASLDLLRVVARGLSDTSILITATYRADELPRSHPLYQLLPLLVREARAVRLDLHPLDREAVLAFVRTRCTLSADAEARLAGYLAIRAEGNPLFTGELLRAIEETGTLARDGDNWVLGDLATVGVPPLLRQVIDARVDRLGNEARAFLALAAVIGQDVAFDLWAALGDTTDEDLLATVERAVEARLLSLRDDGEGVRFAHALIREALYEATMPPLRRRWHRRIGEALAAIASPDPDAVAYHFRVAADPRAAEWLIRAGERAQRAYAWATAAERYGAALASQADQTRDGASRATLLLRLARVKRYIAPRQCLAYLEEVARWGASQSDRALVAFATYEGGLMRCFTGDLPGGLAALAEGAAAQEALVPDERAHLAALLTTVDERIPPEVGWGTVALWLDMAGRFAEARTIAERAVAEGAPSVDALAALVDVYASMGLPQEARHAAVRACELHRANEHHLQLGMVLNDTLALIALPYAADDLAGRRRLAEQADRALAQGASLLPDNASPGIAWLPLHVVEGRWEEVRHLAATEPSVAESTFTLYFVYAAIVFGHLARASGDAEKAWEYVRHWLPTGPDLAPGEIIFRPAVDLQLLAAHLALDAGDLTTAHSWLSAHDRWLAWSGAVLGQAERHLGWAAFHRAAGELATAREHAEEALARASAPRQPLTLLAAHRALGELASTAGHHDDARTHLDTAVALAEACGAPYERGLTLLALAELRVAERKPALASNHLDEARAIFARLEAVPALARADALAGRLATPPPAARADAAPFGLTAREVEVLRLLAEGLTDAQIGARLFVSRNTVNAHLRGVYGKLGVTSRAAATRLALEHHLA